VAKVAKLTVTVSIGLISAQDTIKQDDKKSIRYHIEIYPDLDFPSLAH
jgi:hypothetical protein